MAFNWAQGSLGGLGGAATGAKVGSFFGPIGTAIGAGVGGLGGLLATGLTGNVRSKNVNKSGGSNMQNENMEGFQQSPNKFSPQQQAALNALLAQGQIGLANPTAGFDPIESAARSKFQRESIPGLAERFTSLGRDSALGSSEFAGMLGGAQSEFDQGIAALKAQYGQQGQQNALNMLQLGLTPQNEQIYFGASPSVGGQIAEMGGDLLGKYLAGGGDFGIADYKKNKAKKQADAAQLATQKGTFAKQLAMKRMQAGGV